MAFRVGQKVVCVDASEWMGWAAIKEGAVYTVRIVTMHTARGKTLPALHIDEITTPLGVPFWAYRFRPAVEKKPDISIFTAMLDKAPEHVG